MLKCMVWGEVPTSVLQQAECEIIQHIDGAKALENAQVFVPALLITALGEGVSLDEICELAQWLTESRVIVYGECDVKEAKQLLNAGVFALASDENELYGAILRGRADGDSQQNLKRELRLLHAKVQRSSNLLREKFMADMLFGGNLSSLDVQRQLEFFDIHLDRFALLAIELDPLANLGYTLSEDDVNTLIFIVVEQIETRMEERGRESIVCVRSRRIYTVIPSIQSESRTRREMLSLADEISSAMEAFGRFTVSVGISRVHRGIQQLRSAREEGDRSLAARFHYGDNCIFHVDDLPVLPDALPSTSIDIEPFRRAIGSGANVMEEAQNLARRFSDVDPTQVKNIAVEAITAGVLAYCEAFGTMQELFGNGALPLDRVLQAATVEAVSGELLDVAGRIHGAITRKLSSNAGRAIETAKAYIEAHYADEVTLADVAGSVHMSQWYFSKLFRKETGTTFSEYLIDLRIRKAKEIIRSDAGMKNYEVAERVGFSDARYFGQLFKKTTGMTPGEYRRIPIEVETGQAKKYAPVRRGATDKGTNFAVSETVEKQGDGIAEAISAKNLTQERMQLMQRIPGMITAQGLFSWQPAIVEAVETGRSGEVKELTHMALSEDVSAEKIIDAMRAAMDQVGERFRCKEIFVPEMLLAARAMSTGLDQLQPLLMGKPAQYKGRILIGTVAGDLHDLGKNLVAMMLRGAGYDVIDLGVNVTEEQFVEAIRQHNPDIVGLSALLTTTVDAIGSTIAAIQKAGLRNSVGVMVGGAPLTAEAAAGYGADGYSEDAAQAVDLARQLMKERVE